MFGQTVRQLIRLSGDTMDRDNNKKSELSSVEGPALPQLPEGLESAFNRGHTLSIEGTNVIRVPFGTRRSRRSRPERPDHWATLVTFSTGGRSHPSAGSGLSSGHADL